MMLTCTQLLRQFNRQFPANSPVYFYLFPFPSEKVEFFARVSKLRSKVSYGRIVSVDSKLVFLENAQGGLHRLSYKTQDAFLVSKREVRPDDVEPKKTKLWLPNMYGYLEPVTAPNKIILSLWIKRKPRIVWYKENDGKLWKRSYCFQKHWLTTFTGDMVVFTEADTNRLTNWKNPSTDQTDTLNQNPNRSIRN